MTDPLHDYSNDAQARVNRVAKATRLADAVEDLGRVPDSEERRRIMRQLGIRSASHLTWSMAIDIYLERRGAGS